MLGWAVLRWPKALQKTINLRAAQADLTLIFHDLNLKMPLQELLAPIPSLAQAGLQSQLQHALDNKTKPLGALGQIEALALRLGLILGSPRPELQAPQILVYAADHGLAAHGVSAEVSTGDYMALTPRTHGSDGFFAAVLERAG